MCGTDGGAGGRARWRSAVVAGNSAALFAAFGICGNVVLAPIMQATKQYRLLQQLVTAGSACGVTLLLFSNRPDNLAGAHGHAHMHPRLCARSLNSHICDQLGCSQFTRVEHLMCALAPACAS